MSERHNLSLQELFRLGYRWRTWKSLLLKGWKLFLMCSELCQCILHRVLSVQRYEKDLHCYHLFYIFSLCSSSSRKKNWAQTDSKQGSWKKDRHYIAKTVDFQFRIYVFWSLLTKHSLFCKNILRLQNQVWLCLKQEDTHLDCALPFQVMPCLVVSFVAFRL